VKGEQLWAFSIRDLTRRTVFNMRLRALYARFLHTASKAQALDVAARRAGRAVGFHYHGTQ
jgi:hypothetical protein